MADYRKLELKEDAPRQVESWDDIPEQIGQWPPPPPPGDYEFELPPESVLAGLWDAFETAVPDPRTGETNWDSKVQRVNIEFTPNAPLRIVRSKGGNEDSLVFLGRISNRERNRARKGDPPKLVSDGEYLLRDGLGHKGSRPATNKAFIEAVNSHAGERFVAAVEWSANCRDDVPRYVMNESGATEKDPSGAFGCGARYYNRDIPKDEHGQSLDRFTCSCGAALRCFAALNRFRPAMGTP